MKLPKIDLLNTYVFETNHGEKITIKAYFKEEAIIEFQEDYQKIGLQFCNSREVLPTLFIIN